MLALNVAVVASGIAALTRDVSVPVSEVRPPNFRAGRAGAENGASSAPTAHAILRRNAFDSVTGPLDVAPISVDRLIAELAAVRALVPLPPPERGAARDT